MIDIIREIEAIQREVGEGQLPAGVGRAVRAQRDYDAPIEDVWDALTNPERIGRWFLPISGDYRVGGHYQFEGNAGGEILACERPHRLKVTWVYGEVTSDADVSESKCGYRRADGERRDFSSSTPRSSPRTVGRSSGRVPSAWAGTWGCSGSRCICSGGSIDDPMAWQLSAEGREFATRSSEAWGEANRGCGRRSGEAARGVANTTAFYAPDPDAVS